jgi:protein-tyrosine phosphatase
MLRSVRLPDGVPGELRLHSMPGRYEPLAGVCADIQAVGIDIIICLAPVEEIRRKSPAYADALAENALPCPVEHFPVSDYGVPANREAFWSLASGIANRLNEGRRVLIHCGAGLGRTGTLATCVLLALGVPQEEAARAVSAAGSHPENAEQRALVSWCANRSRAK